MFGRSVGYLGRGVKGTGDCVGWGERGICRRSLETLEEWEQDAGEGVGNRSGKGVGGRGGIH